MSTQKEGKGKEYSPDQLRIKPPAFVYLTYPQGEQTARMEFLGVTAVEHNLSLNLETSSSEGGDLVNGAKNQPTVLTVSVLESDTERDQGGSRKVLETLSQLKKQRTLCTVYTSMGQYPGMLVTGIDAVQDPEVMEGWKGTLTFTEYLSSAAAAGGSTGAVRNNSSTRTNVGTGTTKKLTGQQTVRVLQLAGVRR